ncbi:MAG: hypothetical protein ACWA40_06940 [Planktomarina sp.]
MTRIWNDMITHAPMFTRHGLFWLLMLAPITLAAIYDPRMIEGASIWLKPGKFAFAISIFLLTLAYFTRFTVPGFTERPRIRLFSQIVLFAIIGEMIWIMGAAMYGTTSHFNESTLLMQILYPIMGIFAVTLTAAAWVWGRNIYAQGGGWNVTIGASLMATFVATVIIAGTLSQMGGHFIGTPQTGAALPIMGWSREVGDLRIAHFMATHLMHLVPLTALALAALKVQITPRLGLILLGIWTAATFGTFIQALLGYPLFPF